MDNKKMLKAILLVIISFYIHRASILVLPLLFLLRKNNITKKRYFGLLVGTIPVFFLSKIIYSKLIIFLMTSFRKGYLGHDLILNNMMLILILISIIILLFYNFPKDNEKLNSISCYGVIMSILFSIFGLYNDNLARAVQFYNVFLIIIIPEVIYQYNKQKAIIFVKLLIYLLLVMFMVYSLNNSKIIPYRLIESINFF